MNVFHEAKTCWILYLCIGTRHAVYNIYIHIHTYLQYNTIRYSTLNYTTLITLQYTALQNTTLNQIFATNTLHCITCMWIYIYIYTLKCITIVSYTWGVYIYIYKYNEYYNISWYTNNTSIYYVYILACRSLSPPEISPWWSQCLIQEPGKSGCNGHIICCSMPTPEFPTQDLQHIRYIDTYIYIPAGPETVPIKRTFFFLKKNSDFYHSAVLIWWLEILEKLGARFFRFSASSLQRMRSKQLAVSILVNASPLPSSSIHHQEVTFGTQVAGNWLFHQIPHKNLWVPVWQLRFCRFLVTFLTKLTPESDCTTSHHIRMQCGCSILHHQSSKLSFVHSAWTWENLTRLLAGFEHKILEVVCHETHYVPEISAA